jgi:hypothetical protein
LKKTANILRGALALQSPYILALPFPEEFKDHPEMETLVNEIISRKKDNPNADVFDLEKRIDELVYGVFDLVEEEIEIIFKS